MFYHPPIKKIHFVYWWYYIIFIAEICILSQAENKSSLIDKVDLDRKIAAILSYPITKKSDLSRAKNKLPLVYKIAFTALTYFLKKIIIIKIDLHTFLHKFYHSLVMQISIYQQFMENISYCRWSVK